jgi:hypothetical protein
MTFVLIQEDRQKEQWYKEWQVVVRLGLGWRKYTHCEIHLYSSQAPFGWKLERWGK